MSVSFFRCYFTFGGSVCVDVVFGRELPLINPGRWCEGLRNECLVSEVENKEMRIQLRQFCIDFFAPCAMTQLCGIYCCVGRVSWVLGGYASRAWWLAASLGTA
jgi:hypothetical protein